MHPVTLKRSAKENDELKRRKLGIWTAVLKPEREVYEYIWSRRVARRIFFFFFL
jgi:hypothetical protein